MQKLIGCIVMVSLIVFGGTTVQAGKGNKAKKSAEERFKKLDRNSDEKVSLEEFIGKRTGEKKDKSTKRFNKLDKNSDSSLTLEEYKAGDKDK